MKTIYITLLTLFPILAAGQSDSLTAEQILDSSLVFCGGEKRIGGIESSDLNYLLIQPDKSTAIINEKRKAGQKYVQSVLSLKHVPQTTFFDGEEFTTVNGSSVVRLDSASATEEIRLKTYDQVQYGYKILKYDLTRLPDQKFQNFDCYVLNATGANGYSTTNFFDKTNFRLLMVVYPGGNKSAMVEYMFKDSVLFNSHIVNTFVGSDELQVMRLQNVNLNVSISDLWFKCPYVDSVFTPSQIKVGEFESTNGVKTIFTRTDISQDYFDVQGKPTIRRFLMWSGYDTYLLIDEKSIAENTRSPESEILVRIISWDEDEYVCHWVAGKFTDTQDYKLKN